MKRPAGPLHLKRIFEFEEEFDEVEWTVTEATTIRTGSRSSVFRVQIHRLGDVPLDAVLKLDPTGKCEAAYKNELEAYQTKGKDLQGSALPIFYGCFQVQVATAMVTCLAMEYCGEPMQQHLHEIINPFLGELLLTVATLHQHGLTHGDLYERNILVLNNHPVLIDLESAEIHVCGLRMKTVPGALKPTVEEFGCEELHSLVFRMGIWRSDILRFCTANIAKASIHSVDDIKRVIPQGGSLEWRKTLEAKANILFEEVCEQRRLTYGKDKLSECKARIDYITPEDVLAAERDEDLEDLGAEDPAEDL